MRYLTFFTLVSLVLAVAWTNFVAVQAPDVEPTDPGGAPEPEPEPATIVAVAEHDPGETDPSGVEPSTVSAEASTTVVLVPVVDPSDVADPGLVVPEPSGVDPVPAGVDPVPAAVDPVPAAVDPVPAVVDPVPPVVEDVAAEATEVPQTEHVTEPEPDPTPVVTQPVPPEEGPEAIVADASEPTAPEEVPPVETPAVEAAAPVTRTHELLGRVVNTAGDAVPNVQVLMTDLAGQVPARLLLVDGAGAFAAESVDPGRYALSIAPRSLPKGLARPTAVGVCRTGDEPAGFGSVCVELLATPEVTTTELVLPFSSVIAGNVVDVDGEPVGGAIVRALAQVDRFRAVNEILRTDGLGRFALTLVPGPYELQVLVPGRGGAHDRVSSRIVEAEEGTIYVLDAIVMAPPAPVVTDVTSGATTTDDTRPDTPEPVDAVRLEGRVVTRWGEPVADIEVACVSRNGVELDRVVSDATGTYEFADIPIGTFDVVAGPPSGGFEAGRSQLLSKPEPVAVDVRPTAPEAVVDDIVVEVERVFQVAGRIEIDPAALQMFKVELLERDPAMMSLPEYRFRRAYLRGLRLSVQMIEARRGEARPVRVADDGTFTWTCALPSQDVAFVLEPRSERLGGAYPERLVRPVSPSGVRKAEIVFECAPAGVAHVASKR